VKITLEKAQDWVKKYGDCVDFCGHITAETMTNEAELFGYSEFDSFGPVVIYVHCAACAQKMMKDDPEGATGDPFVGYDYGQVHTWQDAYSKLLDLVLNDTVTHVAVASQADYHGNNFAHQQFETIDAFDLLLSVSPRRFPKHPNLQLLCKWIAPADQQPFRSLIIVPMKWDEKFVPVPDLMVTK